MAKIARELAPCFTVFTYDRRGRGESGKGGEYAVEREIEDLQALIAEAGGSVSLFGISSGAILALEAAAHGLAVEKLALYEAPFIVDAGRPPTDGDWKAIDAHVAAERPGDAAKVFLKLVGVPGLVVRLMPWLPAWSKLCAAAVTLPHDGAVVRAYQRGEPLPAGRWASVTVPVLALDGAKSPPWMRNGMRALAAALPRATYRSLDGQTHDVKAKAVAPELRAFL
jgi:pimeloyl-ACP methyl ester carboxylesterase